MRAELRTGRGARSVPPMEPPAEAELFGPSPVRVYVSFLACLLGLGAATYLTIVHYATGLSISCPLTNKAINCEKVTTSPQSVVFGIPVAVLGLAFFVVMVVLCAPPLWRSPNRYVAPLRLALSVSGIGFVFYLLYAELFVIHAICLWCSSVHVLTFIVFVTVVTGWEDATAAREAARA